MINESKAELIQHVFDDPNIFKYVLIDEKNCENLGLPDISSLKEVVQFYKRNGIIYDKKIFTVSNFNLNYIEADGISKLLDNIFHVNGSVDVKFLRYVSKSSEGVLRETEVAGAFELVAKYNGDLEDVMLNNHEEDLLELSLIEKGKYVKEIKRDSNDLIFYEDL